MAGAAVYRFDVTGGRFQLARPYANQMVVPPLVVQGSIDGTTWTDLGSLVPATAPTIKAVELAELTFGPATFWWENPIGQPAYEHIRVAFGSGGPLSAAVTLAGLAAPAATNSTGPEITATAPGVGRPDRQRGRPGPAGGAGAGRGRASR